MAHSELGLGLHFPSPPSLGVPDGGEGGRGRAWLRPWREEIGAARDFPERPLSDHERFFVLTS